MTVEATNKQEHQDVVKTIVLRLGETNPNGKYQIDLIVGAIGVTRTLDLLKTTIAIEERGGMMVLDGSRRRTPGGLFIYLAKCRYRSVLPPVIWPSGKTPLEFPGKPFKKKERDPNAPVPPPQEKKKPLSWEDRESVIEELLAEEKGQAMMKLSVVGRPHNVLERGTTVILTMTDKKVPSLPAGLPTPAEGGTTLYTIYIASKQWKKVAHVMDDPEDVLILEGYPQLDEKTHSIAVFVTGAKSKKTEMSKKERPA